VKELLYGGTIIVMGVLGAVSTALVTLVVRQKIIERFQPDFRWDWDFIGYIYLIGGGLIGFLLVSGFTAWTLLKFDK
jgi:hypothetical protein